jgi:hypothetical protein
MSWIFKNKQVEDISSFPEFTYGFVYIVTHKPTGKRYIGKKVLNHTKKVKLTKKDLLMYEGQPGRKPIYKLVTKESDWKTYYGSNKKILELIKEGKQDEFDRMIIYLAPNKKTLTYLETKCLFVYEVLEKPDEFFNDNILGKFYSVDFEF